MKRMCLILACLVLASGAIAQEVQSVNAVGFKTVTVENGFNLLALNWDDVGGGEVSIQDVLDKTTLQSGPVDTQADKILVWDPTANAGAGGYVGYYLSDGYYGYYVSEVSNKWVKTPGPKNVAATNTLTAGTGLWLVRRGAQTTTSIKGEVPVAPTTSQLFGAGGKFTLFGSAYPADLELNGSVNDWSAGNEGPVDTQADKILVWDPTANAGTGGYVSYYLSDGYYGYYVSEVSNKWVKTPGPKNVATSDSLALGAGAWYRTAPASSSDVVWQEVKPYTYGD